MFSRFMFFLFFGVAVNKQLIYQFLMLLYREYLACRDNVLLILYTTKHTLDYCLTTNCAMPCHAKIYKYSPLLPS